MLVLIPARAADEHSPKLSVKEIMNNIVTPATNTIWGAYQLKTEAQWDDVRRAAEAVIDATSLLRVGGSNDSEARMAAQAEWQTFNQQLLDAAEQVLMAAENRDEDTLSQVGNDALYPPCESCHQVYQKY